MIIVLFILIIINISFIIYNKIKAKDIVEKLKQKVIEKKEDEFKQIIQKYIENINKLDEDVNNKRKLCDELIKKEEEKTDLILRQKQEIINKKLEQYEKEKISELETKKEKLLDSFEQILEYQLQKMVEEYLEYEKIKIDGKEKIDKDLVEIKNKLEDYRVKHEVIKLSQEKTNSRKKKLFIN